MKQKILLYLIVFIGYAIQSQTTSSDFRVKKILITSDTIQLDSVALNPAEFKILDSKLKKIAVTEYQVDFSKALLFINSKKYSEITVEYYRLPDFITKTYSPFENHLILPNNTNTGKLYSLTTNKETSEIKLFNGLKTKGFISRGITFKEASSTLNF